ncbi:MAG: substrate-binding domain-containing protein [Leifsonia sp.]
MKATRNVAWIAILATSAIALAGCSATQAQGGSSSTAAANVTLTAEQLSKAGSPEAVLNLLKPLKGIASAGKGKIAVLLPDTQSSARYVEQDTPDFEKAFAAMGISKDDYMILNAQNSTQTQQTQAEQAISNGASVLLLDNLDSGSGAAIQADAREKGVPTIDYDRLTVGGSADYYVSFDNQYVGTALAQGLTQCISDWSVADPNVYILAGSPTDNNATLSQVGIDNVIKPLVSDGKMKLIDAVRVPNWDNQVGQTMFEQAYTAHSQINAVLTGNDGLAQSVISVLKNQGVKPRTVPTTGQDATLQGMQNILAGYQCMSVYKQVYVEAAAAAALAVMVRAGVTPPKDLVNGSYDAKSKKVPSVLLKPVSVDARNMNDTVIRDGVVKAAELCTGDFAEACAKAGIK